MIIQSIFNHAEISNVLKYKWKNTIKIYNYNNGNSSNNSRHPKLIGFFINNKSNYFKQLTKAIIMI